MAADSAQDDLLSLLASRDGRGRDDTGRKVLFEEACCLDEFVLNRVACCGGS